MKLKPEKINYRQLKWIIIIIPDYWQHSFIISRSLMIYYVTILPSSDLLLYCIVSPTISFISSIPLE